MKKFLFVFSAIVTLAAGCAEVLPEPEIVLDKASKETAEFTGEGGKSYVTFSSALEWHVEVSEDWLEVNPSEGGPGSGRITIRAEKNTRPESRTGVVNICSGTLKFPINVLQEAYVETFELLETEKDLTCMGGEVTVQVNADVDYEVAFDADWISIPGVKAPYVRTHLFYVEPNPLDEPRTAVISFIYGTTVRTFTLTQRAAGSEGDDWMYDAFVHRSLAMRFTADWCGYCPMMGTAFSSAASQMRGRLLLVSLHGSQSTYEFEHTNTLADRFLVSGYPTGVVDARASIPNYSSISTTAGVAMEVAEETQASYPAKTGIACSSTLEGNILNADVQVYVKEPGSYRTVVLLLEDGIVGYQNGGGNDYVHNDVARFALTSVSGEPFTMTESGIWTGSYSAELDQTWNKDNLRLLIYVEKAYGDQKKVKNVEGATYSNFGDTYIDNCRAVRTGTVNDIELQ